jgi:hypothetical protein
MKNGLADGSSGLNKGAVAGGLALIGLGAAAATAGAVICALVGAAAVRSRWSQWREMPSTVAPTDLALQQWKRAASAGRVGFDAWRGAGSTSSAIE